MKKLIGATCFDATSCESDTDHSLQRAFLDSRRFLSASRVFADQPIDEKVHLRFYRANSPPERQGDLIILKRPVPQSGELGVLALNYTPTFERFAAIFDLKRLLKSYRCVFEPSSYRNVEPSLFLYYGRQQLHIMQCAHADDEKILADLPHCLATVNLGSGDWIDPRLFCDAGHERRLYDIAMVASWSRLKRHEVVFAALKQLKSRGRDVSIALVGYPGDLTRRALEELAMQYGILAQCTFFENLAHPEVARILALSSVAIHFSRAEGTNRASYEAWFCNVPTIVYRHNLGFRLDYVNAQTGLLADDLELPETILYALDNRESFSPRRWLLERSSYSVATERLNELLQQIATDRKEPWTRDIVQKINSPYFIYANETDRLVLAPAYEDLKQFLR